MVLWHVAEVLRWESDQRQWALSTAAHVWWGKSEQQRLWRTARQGSGAGKKRKSVYEAVPDDVRVRMIGNALAVTAGRWALTHQRQMRWLADHGVTPAEAVRRHDEWLAERMSDPRFAAA